MNLTVTLLNTFVVVAVGAILTFLMLPVNLRVIEHGWRCLLTWWHLAQGFLVGLEHGKNHGSHLSGNASQHLSVCIRNDNGNDSDRIFPILS